MAWLNQNTGAVLAIMAIVIVVLIAVLTAVTCWYARLTGRMALPLEQRLAASVHPDIEMTLNDRSRGQGNSLRAQSSDRSKLERLRNENKVLLEKKPAREAHSDTLDKPSVIDTQTIAEQASRIVTLQGQILSLKSQLYKLESRVEFVGLGNSVHIGGDALGLSFVYKNANEDTPNVACQISAGLAFSHAGDSNISGQGVWVSDNDGGSFGFLGPLEPEVVDIWYGQSFRLIYLIERNQHFYLPNSFTVPLQPGLYKLRITIKGANVRTTSGVKSFRVRSREPIDLTEFSWENDVAPQLDLSTQA